MFKKSLTNKKIIKRAEKLFNYFKLLKSTTNEKYPLLDDEDVEDKRYLLKEIDILINNLKISTKEYLNNTLSITEFNIMLDSINNSYNELRLNNSIFNAIIYGYLTPPSGGGFGTPVPNTSSSFEYLFDRFKNG